MIKNLFLCGIFMIALSTCNNKSGRSMKLEDYSIEADTVKPNQTDKELTVCDSIHKDTLNTAKVDKSQISSDTTDESLDTPPYLPAQFVNALEYLRTNNKYKDWDPKNPKIVGIKAIIEKDGSLTNVAIGIKCDEESLNKEAFRLINDAIANGVKIEPAKNARGNPIRMRWGIYVSFPPK